LKLPGSLFIDTIEKELVEKVNSKYKKKKDDGQ